MKEMEYIQPKSVDMILCDLPYGTTNIAWDKQIPFKLLWKQYEQIIKDNGAIVLFSIQPFTTDLIMSNRKLFRYEIIWKKSQPTGFLNAHKMPLRNHENILVFYKKLPTYNPQKTKVNRQDVGRTRLNGTGCSQYHEYMKPTWSYTENGERYPTDVIEYSNWNGALFGKTKNATKHPTQKPVDLCKYLVLTYTNRGDMVLDNCMGTGTTGIACIETQRGFVGIESNHEYYLIAEERIKQAQAQSNVEIKEVRNGEDTSEVLQMPPVWTLFKD